MNAVAGHPHVWRATADLVTVRVRLTPKAAADAVVGIGDTADGPALLVRVRAVPERGAANEALEKVVAGWLGVPAKSVAVAAGARSRLKTVTVAGDARDIGQRIRHRLQGMG